MRPRSVLLLALLVPLAACSAPPPLDRQKVGAMIEATAAFQAPPDQDLRQLDPRYADPSLRRQVIEVETIGVDPDGPFGMAGQTATVRFAWRWNPGPFGGVPHRGIAKIHGTAKGWTVYEDALAKNLRQAIGGEQ